MNAEVVTVAIPCRSDEPALGRTLAAAWTSWQAAAHAATRRLEVLACVNGDPGAGRACAELLAFAGARNLVLTEVDLDASASAAGPGDVVVLSTRREGKARAWNALRRRAGGAAVIFMDADVSFAADAFGLLLHALDEHPDAVLASAKTTCAPRATLFESVMAAPYGVDFPNLSPQLYAARTSRLPPQIPETLLDPERWLELTVGAEHIVRAPGARVVVRLPATLGDFFRQRVRLEMAKLQLAAEHPEIAGRGTVQPGLRAALGQLGAPGLVRLGMYLALRAGAHAVARHRYGREATTGVWPAARSTKRWDAP